MSESPDSLHPPSDDDDEEDKYSKARHRRRKVRINGHHAPVGKGLRLASPAWWAHQLRSPYLYLLLFGAFVTAALLHSSPAASTPQSAPANVTRPAPSPAAAPASPHAVIAPAADEEWRKQICGDAANSDNLLCDDVARSAHEPSSAALSPSDVTLFTVFMPEEGDSHTSWLRAMYSWTLHVPEGRHIMVLVRTAEHCTILRDLPTEVHCRVSHCFAPGDTAPPLRCVLEDANRRADTALMAYVEDHIVLFADFVPALLKVASRLDDFFLVGSSSALTLTVDARLDLNTWQRDVESALFLDSSDLSADRDHSRHAATNHSHSLHYFAYSRTRLDLSTFAPSIVMGGGQYYGHQWEKILVAFLLLQDRVTLVDVTQAVTAVEMSHADSSNYTQAINTRNALSTANSSTVPNLSLGRLENAHFVLFGKCPTCSLKENREADLPLILIRHANPQRQIIVILVNSVYLSLAFNWICRARVLGLSNFVMLAEDRVAYRILRKMDVPVVLRKDAPYMKEAAMRGSAEFQETLYLRALFFREVVGLGFHLILSHLDTIWFEDPLPYIAGSDCDMFVQMEDGRRADGGIIFIRSSSLGQQFARDYLICEQENWEFITVHGKSRFYYSDDPDMNCVDLISQRLVRRNHLKRCVLDRERYVGEERFFDRQTSQHKAIFPAFVHINRANGLMNKTKVFLDWDLWAVDDSAMVAIPPIRQAHAHGSIQCKPPPAEIAPPLFEERESMRVVVNVLAATEHFALEQTLEHLAAADYDGRVKVDLRITIQQPEHDSSTNTKQYVKTVAVAKDFQWQAGSKRILFLDSHCGPTDRWLDHWMLGDEESAEVTFQLALQAGQSLSVTWFTWVRAALDAYYFDPFSYSPQLMGIHLQHQFTIVGETPAARFGSRVPSTVLQAINASTTPTLYHYQFLPLFGTLFFPQHFLSFLHWYAAQNHSTVLSAPSTPGASPVPFSPIACVPTLISNAWYREDGVRHWWQWLVRFTFESGWYGLYTNFHSADRHPRALAVDQTPLAGQLTVSLISKLSAREMTFPPLRDVELYDLHFNRFTMDRRMLAVRKTLFPPAAVGRRSVEEESAAEAERRREWERERERWSKERGGSGSDVDDGDDSVAGLWSNIHMRRREAALAEIADQQVMDESLDDKNPLTLEQDFVTPTDLVIDMMKTIMTESDDLNPSEDPFAQLDASTFRAKMDRLAVKLKHIRAGDFHRHTQVRGSHHDRCFVIGDPINDPGDAAVQADLNVVPLPYPFNASLTLVELYTTTYQDIVRRLPKTPGDLVSDPLCRFIVYRPSTAANNFDRHLRGIYFAFLVALVSQRVFLVDLPDFEAMYDCPIPGVKWQYSAFEKHFVNKKDPEAKPVTIGEITAKKITADLRTRYLNDIYPQQLLFHVDAVAHDRLLFTNTNYRPYAIALFETHSRMKRTGMIMRLVQSKPKNALIQAGKDLQKSIGLTSVKYSVCVHLVAPPERMKKVTADDPIPGVSDAHWECIQSQLLHLGFTRDDVVIFFTTNSPLKVSTEVGAKQLERYGKVVGANALYESDLTRWGMSNATYRASWQKDPFTAALIYDPYVVNHFVFGDCDVSVSSGTTYGIFGAARTGFSRRAYVYRGEREEKKDNKTGKILVPGEKDYCGPMHRVDLQRENDINF